MKEALVRLGVPPDRILMETESRNTYTEALVVAPMLRKASERERTIRTPRGLRELIAEGFPVPEGAAARRFLGEQELA